MLTRAVVGDVTAAVSGCTLDVFLLQKADEEAAKLYEDFVESFAEDPAEKGPKAFVRGEVIQPGQRPSDSGSLAAGCRHRNYDFDANLCKCKLSVCAGEPSRRPGKYVPKFLPPSMVAAMAAPESKPKALEVSRRTFNLFNVSNFSVHSLVLTRQHAADTVMQTLSVGQIV